MRRTAIAILTIAALATIMACISRNNEHRQIMDLFATADSTYRSGNHTKAITLALETAEKARSHGDHYLAGKAEDLTADIIGDSYGGADVIKHRLRAATDYLNADSLRDHRYALIDVAVAYANIDSALRACRMLDSLRMLDTADSVFVTACMRTSLPLAISIYDYGGAFWLSHYLGGDYSKFYSPDAVDYACKAIMNSNSNSNSNIPPNPEPWLEKAKELVSTPAEREFVNFAIRRCAYNSNNYDIYHPMTDSVKSTTKAEKIQAAKTPVITAQRDFFDTKADRQSAHSRRLTVIISLCALAVTLICAGLVTFFRMKIRLKDAEIDSRMEALARVTEELNAEQNETAAMRLRVTNLFRERWDTLNLLCNEFFEKGDSEKARASIVNEVEKELERLRTPRKLRQIEDSVNECMDGLISRLRSQCPFLKEDDIVFLTLIHAGFSPRAVSLFTGVKLKYFYTKRQRLVERINASDAPDRELFIPKA